MLLPLAAFADLLVIPEGAGPTTPVDKPDKGMHMSQVIAKYGEPASKHPPVGGGNRFQPPITRWDYPQFTVVFEHDIVIDAVVPEQPAKVYPTAELKPAPEAAAPEPTPTP
jgi:hypothetical protein